VEAALKTEFKEMFGAGYCCWYFPNSDIGIDGSDYDLPRIRS